jgi:hypothetical protein
MSQDTLTRTEEEKDQDFEVETSNQSCHGGQQEEGHKHGRGLGHMAMMVLCCAAPIIVLSLLPLIAKLSPAFGGILSKGAWLLCPIMMVFMIPMMMKGRKHKHTAH